ncbi:MAG: aminoacyl-histidine dipeptidase [Bacteroidales bacterium]|nr:aminoacyl-histidine dipeptidase [Candidatus Physcousia equi]
MNKVELKPTTIFECFAEVNKVPRPSKREEKMIEFLLQFGKTLGLDTQRDECGNVIIRKPATAGMEGKPTVILQSHMDMVCEPSDGSFDFENLPIETYVDGEWMRAKGTTLGADDGIGIAMEMALLKSTDIEHGPIECVFTRDEETGLTGAEAMKPGFMSGQYLINLDSEDEGQIFVSCAGGCRTTATFHYEPQAVPEGMFFARLSIAGLTGGHSGDDINKKRANANKLLIRFLYQTMKQTELHLVDLQSGGLHNAIPREGYAVIAVPRAWKEQLAINWNIYRSEVEQEYEVTEPKVVLDLESCDAPSTMIDDATAHRLIMACQAVDNGVYAMCQSIKLVETSSNLASIRVDSDTHTININSSQRSSLLSARRNMSDTIEACFQLAGAEVNVGEGYPGWAMNPNSRLLSVATEQYCNLFGKEPIVRGIHAGLECGLFSEKYPHLDMVSFGPTLRGVHSPDEKLHIPTVQMVWDHLLAILKNI